MGGKGSVLVTGGAKRIGKAICDVLRERGWNVLVHSRDPQNPLCMDFESEVEDLRAFFKKVVKTAPDLYAIVNNASIFSSAKEMSEDEKDRIMAINVAIPSVFTNFFYEHLKKKGGRGCVVNMLDARVLRDEPETYYEETKSRLFEFTLDFATECAPHLRVNGVAPGPILPPTDMAHSVPGGKILLDERPTPRDVAEAVAYLLEAKSVTGQVIAVDSGQTLLPR